MPNSNTKNIDFLGRWGKDSFQMPCFTSSYFEKLPLPYPCWNLLSSGKISVLADQNGNIAFFPADNKTTLAFNPTYRTDWIPSISYNGVAKSLIFADLSETEKISIKYGTTYIEYNGKIKISDMEIKFSTVLQAVPTDSSYFILQFSIENLSEQKLNDLKIEMRSDLSLINKNINSQEKVFSKNGKMILEGLLPGKKDIFLMGEPEWKITNRPTPIILSRIISIDKFSSQSYRFLFGIEKDISFQKMDLYYSTAEIPDIREKTNKRLKKNISLNNTSLSAKRECIWTRSQIETYTAWDSVSNLFYSTPTPNSLNQQPIINKDLLKTAFATSSFLPKLSISNLKLVMSQYREQSYIPKFCFDLNKDNILPKSNNLNTYIWFIIAGTEILEKTLNKQPQNQKKLSDLLIKQMLDAFRYIEKESFRGYKGFLPIYSLTKNYNSHNYNSQSFYSVSNTASALYALHKLYSLMSKQKKRDDATKDIPRFCERLRLTVSEAFDGNWFVFGYDKDENPVGNYASEQLFTIVQAWAALAKCGTLSQRKKALLKTLELCHTKHGLTYISKPFYQYNDKSPEISLLPPGEYLNAGILPEVHFLFTWALADCGMIEEARNEWKMMSLKNHLEQFPNIPFGIINGPKSYCSHFAGKLAGFPQCQSTDISRIPHISSVLWQEFAMNKIIRPNT
ncbi:MAG: hypothetical protein U9O87_06325 [Verrucomicrobiota bacterium]|nr:hypothetical protein [Verrucomicrobiota bacterium]